jgi:hypothetical protein
VSRRGQGRRARGRRGDQDVELENTAWLEELEKAAAEHDDEEEEWASTLRRRRSRSPEPPPPTAPDPPGSTGGRPIGGPPWGPPDPPGPWGSPDPSEGSPEPPRPDPSGARAPELPRAPVAHDLSPYPPLSGEPAPPPPPSRPADGAGPTREPDYRLLGMEPDTGRPAGGWDGGNSHADAAADWTTRDRAPGAPSPAAEPGTDWSAWSQPEGREGPGDRLEGSGEPQGPGGSGGPQGGPPMGRPPVDRGRRTTTRSPRRGGRSSGPTATRCPGSSVGRMLSPATSTGSSRASRRPSTASVPTARAAVRYRCRATNTRGDRMRRRRAPRVRDRRSGPVAASVTTLRMPR